MSFHIASQSITNPRLGLTINFHQNDSDTSKVVLEIVSSGLTDMDEDGHPDGEERPAHTLKLVFNRGGLLLYQKVTDPEGNDFHQNMPSNEIRDPSGAAVPGNVNSTQSLTNPGNNPYAMSHQPVTDRTRPRPNEGRPSDDWLDDRKDRRDDNGRDASADNPYTYQAPVDGDAKLRGDVNVGFTQPPVEGVNDAELRKQAMDDAHARAQEVKDDGKPKPADDAPEPVRPSEPDDGLGNDRGKTQYRKDGPAEWADPAPRPDGKPVKPAPEPA